MKRLLIILLIFMQITPVFAARADKNSGYLLAAKNDGIIYGDENGNLREDDEATRAEFLAFLVRFLGLSGGENTFSDVSENDWFEKYISAASFSGIFSGFSDGTARPHELITTEDAVTILGRYYNAASRKGSYGGVSEYAADYFGYAFENGIFSEWKKLPVPKHGITRGEIISILYRYKEENVQNSCFAKNYPKISDNQVFNRISIDVKTTETCEISYAVQKKGETGYSWKGFADNQPKGKADIIYISADINNIYDVYVKAVSKDSGRTQIKEIKNVAPLAFVRGNGTAGQPYVIYTELQLLQVSRFPDKEYVLGTNIDLSEKWVPIEHFSGGFDGDGYTIKGLSVEEAGQAVGLFADIKGGTVKNLTVDGDIKAKGTAGIIAGENNGGVIEGCCATGSAEVSGNSCGGICGINKGRISNCLSCLYTVRAGSFAGGIAGQNGGSITECLSAAETVTSDMYAGGIAGQNEGRIESCVAANIAVYNTMTYNGGKISTNRNNGKMQNNFSFSGMVSNAARTDDSADSRNGLETEWESIESSEFYSDIGWNMKNWKRANNGFILVCPKHSAEPTLESGKTPYCPKKIATADEFMEIRKNLKGHYVLTRDITLKIPWKTVDVQKGFSGTLDGNGYALCGLILKGENGLFSNITGGTVKNLKIKDVSAVGAGGGIIAACNYGYIENCSVSGEIKTQKSSNTGGIAGENNGRIEGCLAEISFVGENAVIGGICAVNNAVVSSSKFSGNMHMGGESSVIGGICAKDNEGYISECAVNADADITGRASRYGGICGLSTGSQIYKCASTGRCSQSVSDGYSGGICASLDGSVIYDCFSQQNLTSVAENAVSGGICAMAQDSNIQNTYYTGEIRASGENAVSGGICAKANGSFIMQNVTLSPVILGKKSSGAIAAEYSECDITDNYTCIRTLVNYRNVLSSEKNGEIKSVDELLDVEFYIKPLSENGSLGWEDTVWEIPEAPYSLPVLTDMPILESLSNPVFK